MSDFSEQQVREQVIFEAAGEHECRGMEFCHACEFEFSAEGKAKIAAAIAAHRKEHGPFKIEGSFVIASFCSCCSEHVVVQIEIEEKLACGGCESWDCEPCDQVIEKLKDECERVHGQRGSFGSFSIEE